MSDEVMVDPQCKEHETPACWPCSVHAMLMGMEQEKQAWLDGKRCENCGGAKKANRLWSTCEDCD